jgi:alpha-galactosidase
MYAEWGVDYLKYDWCSYLPELEEQRGKPIDVLAITKFWGNKPPSRREQLARPYAIMRTALDRQKRDIVYSLCQYGMGNVWEWGAQVGGDCWRTTGDIVDTWASMSTIGFGQAGREIYAGPGSWNDPDMLVVGRVGWGPDLHPTRLTPNEQYTHVSLWCLLAAPLLIGCDLTQLDEFTLGLLTNDEVIEVNQDPLGRQARPVWRDGELEVWSKVMEDGSRAVGLFNRGRVTREVPVLWRSLDFTGKARVRDLWRQRDVGEFSEGWRTNVPRHGCVLVRVFPAR